MDESATLKKQFEQIQLQQQLKLQRLKQRKEEKEKSQVKLNSKSKFPDTFISTAFGIDDNLDLKLAEPPANNSIYSEELVGHLNDQIRELKDENGRLYKLLSERDFEIRQMRKKQETTPGGSVTNETAATKIVELSKKLRELTAECESEKTKAKQWARKCFDLENQLKSQSAEGSTSAKSVAFFDDDDDTKSSEHEVKVLNEKVKQLESKVAEYRNASASLRQELKIAHKVLASEVGEGVSIQSLLNQPSGWRGRAQQILTLQKKLQELRSQAEQRQLGSRLEEFEDELLRGTSTTGSTTYRQSASEDRQRAQIRKLEKDRKESQERMANELKALEADYESVKGKFEASKARNKVLSNEVKAQKQQIATLLDKGKHDDELIQALMNQLTQLKKLMESSQQDKEREMERKVAEVTQTTLRNQQDNNLVSQLQAIVAEKESKVHDLEREINNLRLSSLQRAQMNNINAMFERAASRAESRLSAGHSSAMIDSLEITEAIPPRGDGGTVSRQSLLMEGDFTERPTSRKNSGRSNHLVSSGEMEEFRRRNAELQSMYQVSEVEKNRLSQLVQVLEQRSKQATEKELDMQKELQSQKRRNVYLEKQLGKEQVTKSAGLKKSASNKTRASMTSLSSVFEEEGPMSSYSREELETKLEIAQDENEAVKAALQRTLKAKEEDLRLYNDIMEETKKLFLQGLRQYRQGSA